MNEKSNGPVFDLCPLSVLATAKPRTRAGLAPEYEAPNGSATIPFPPPPPCIMKSPFQASASGRARAKPMPNSWPSAPLRRLITPSTRQCSGRAPLYRGAPGNGGGMAAPAGIRAALVISTPSMCRPARLAQASAGPAWVRPDAQNAVIATERILVCIVIVSTLGFIISQIRDDSSQCDVSRESPPRRTTTDEGYLAASTTLTVNPFNGLSF